MLEIGTGWGGFAIHAASTYGCRVTTTTISDAQFRYAAKRVAAAGLSDRVTVLDLDYRDLTGTYDKLVSIEMIEAVDWRQHDTFFRHLRLPAPARRAHGPAGDHRGRPELRAGQERYRLHQRDDLPRRLPAIGGGDHPFPAPVHAPDRRGSRGHRSALRGDARCAGTRTSTGTGTAITAFGLDDGSSACGTCTSATAPGPSPSAHISDVQMVLAMPDWRPP